MGLLDDVYWRILLVFVSVLLFRILSDIFRVCRPEAVLPKNVIKWKNSSTSFAHSLLSASGSITCFLENPELTSDIKYSKTQFASAVVCISLGYFLYDMGSEIVDKPGKKVDVGIIAHHIVIALSFVVPVLTGQYTYYATISLLLEINSIFLHMRMLLKLCNFEKNSLSYRFIAYTNLGTFIVFRTLPVMWMVKWLWQNKEYVDWFSFSVAVFGFSGLPVLNSVLLYRILIADFMPEKMILGKSD